MVYCVKIAFIWWPTGAKLDATVDHTVVSKKGLEVEMQARKRAARTENLYLTIKCTTNREAVQYTTNAKQEKTMKNAALSS